MKKKFHICKSVAGCFGATSALVRLPGTFIRKASADAIRARLQSSEKHHGTVYFVEWEWTP